MTKLGLAAALLHDIGHPPLSHSLEPLLVEAFGLDHHKTSENIITGRHPLGEEVREILKENRIDPEEVIAVLSGENDPFDGLFSGPINIDTMDGVARCAATIPEAPLIHSSSVLHASIFRHSEEDREAVDAFWGCKHRVYGEVVQSAHGVLADWLCCKVARDHIGRLCAEDCYITERDLFRKLPELPAALRSWDPARHLPEGCGITWQFRSFHVDEAGDFFAREDSRRYRHGREERTLSRE